MFRRWINLLVMAVFVMTTIPSIGHASGHHKMAVKAVSVEIQQEKDHQDCHGHGQSSGEKSSVKQEKKDSKRNSCCDQTCDCLGGFCNGAAKVLGFENATQRSMPAIVKSSFNFSDQHTGSSDPERLKRPPRI